MRTALPAVCLANVIVVVACLASASLSSTASAPTAPRSGALRRIRVDGVVDSPAPPKHIRFSVPATGDVPANKQITQTEYQIALLKKLEGATRFRPVYSSDPADDDLHGLIFSQQMITGWGAKVILGARYELRDTITSKLLWRSTIVTECPYSDWGGFLFGPEPKPNVAARCALDKNLDRMAAALEKVNF